MSVSKLGKNNSFYGKKHSPETIEKMRVANLGKKHSPETKEKMSVTRMGKKHSPETKEKIRVAVKKYNAKKYYETL